MKLFWKLRKLGWNRPKISLIWTPRKYHYFFCGSFLFLVVFYTCTIIMRKISEKIIIDNGYRKCINRVFETKSWKIQDYLVCGKSKNDSGIGVIWLTEDKKFLLVDEYRVWPEQIIRSCVVWDVEDNGNLEENAKREFLEETGYSFDKIIPIIELINNPYFIGKTSYYLALWCVKIKQPVLEDGEDIICRELSQEELELDIISGNIHCPYLISLYFTAKAKTNNFTTF